MSTRLQRTALCALALLAAGCGVKAPPRPPAPVRAEAGAGAKPAKPEEKAKSVDVGERGGTLPPEEGSSR
jgi:predicted small lipoprotein YifL